MGILLTFQPLVLQIEQNRNVSAAPEQFVHTVAILHAPRIEEAVGWAFLRIRIGLPFVVRELVEVVEDGVQVVRDMWLDVVRWLILVLLITVRLELREMILLLKRSVRRLLVAGFGQHRRPSAPLFLPLIDLLRIQVAHWQVWIHLHIRIHRIHGLCVWVEIESIRILVLALQQDLVLLVELSVFVLCQVDRLLLSIRVGLGRIWKMLLQNQLIHRLHHCGVIMLILLRLHSLILSYLLIE